MARIIFSSPHITHLSVAGFKSIGDEQFIAVRPLTLLAGANSSGKSSMLQPLLLMKQTIEASYDPGALLLNGPNVRFTLAEQLFSLGSQRQFSVTIGTDEGDAVKATFVGPPSRGMEIAETVYSSQETRPYALRPHMPDEEVLAITPSLHDHRYLGVIRERCFLTLETEYDWNEPFDNPAPAHRYQRLIGETIHVPGLRGNPLRSYPLTATDGPQFVGTFEPYTASIVQHWQKGTNPRLEHLREWLRLLKLADAVAARAVDDTSVELRVNRMLGDRESGFVSIADVGFGVSQVLPALVALLVANKGQLVYIEQPELHLHPRAQVALAQVLADAAKRGVRVVVETHSALLLLGIQTLVAEGKLSPELVKLHWFQRRSDDGSTEISSTDLDQFGAFETDWPEDFAEIAMQAESRYLDAIEARRLQPRR